MVLESGDILKLRTIPAGDMGGVNDVAEMHDGNLIIAATKGLFYSQFKGKE